MAEKSISIRNVNLLFRPGYNGTAQPCFLFRPVATRGIAAEDSPEAQKAFLSPQTTIVKEMSVKLLTTHLLQTFDPWRFYISQCQVYGP